MAENDIVVPELDEDGRFTADSVIDQIGEIAAEAAPALDLTGGFDGAVALGAASVKTPGPTVAPGARVYGGLSVAIGAAAVARDASVAVGGKALESNSVAVGASAAAEGIQSIAVGPWAESQRNRATALGTSAEAAGLESTAVGPWAKAQGSGATALGLGAEARGASSVALGADAIAENDNDFVLGLEGHNVKVPGTLSVREPTEPQHAATREYVDSAVASAGGGGGLVAAIPLTSQADLIDPLVMLRLSSPGGVSFLEVNVQLPAGSEGETYEFTLDRGGLSPFELEALDEVGAAWAMLFGLDTGSNGPRPVGIDFFGGSASLTTLSGHGGLVVSSTVPVLPNVWQGGGVGVA